MLGPKTRICDPETWDPETYDSGILRKTFGNDSFFPQKYVSHINVLLYHRI